MSILNSLLIPYHGRVYLMFPGSTEDVHIASPGHWVTDSESRFYAGAAHIAKLLKSEESRGAVGPVLLLSQLLLSELPAPSKARYPPIPPSASLKISSVFVQLGVVEHLRQRLTDATEALTKEPSRQSDGTDHPGEQLPAPHSMLHS